MSAFDHIRITALTMKTTAERLEKIGNSEDSLTEKEAGAESQRELFEFAQAIQTIYGELAT